MGSEELLFELAFPSGVSLLLPGMANYGVASYCAALGQALAGVHARAPGAGVHAAVAPPAAAAAPSLCTAGDYLRETQLADIVPHPDTPRWDHPTGGHYRRQSSSSSGSDSDSGDCATVTATTTTTTTTTTTMATVAGCATASATATNTADDWLEVLMGAADLFASANLPAPELPVAGVVACPGALAACLPTPGSSAAETLVRVTAILHDAPGRSARPLLIKPSLPSLPAQACASADSEVDGGGAAGGATGDATGDAAVCATAAAAGDAGGGGGCASYAAAAAPALRPQPPSRGNSQLLRLLGLPQGGGSMRVPYVAAGPAVHGLAPSPPPPPPPTAAPALLAGGRMRGAAPMPWVPRDRAASGGAATAVLELEVVRLGVRPHSTAQRLPYEIEWCLTEAEAEEALLVGFVTDSTDGGSADGTWLIADGHGGGISGAWSPSEMYGASACMASGVEWRPESRFWSFGDADDGADAGGEV
ncbi:hypothetical protein GPECTOR_555g574 [Gonium pectorale]|uniref:Uncharacterized protein n=1 Tax=Gonium pectorale TaxID=33097 RepID=A0A150FUL4_GONPE|nr:hypothetical protein GPECTOR_555g574 [Gonium pectorale]|eukprot:KXZ41321.1 hypothetical protein GPECTOR_555g574 [Gonium pectorale]